MSEFKQLIQIERVETTKKGRGCSFCPLNEVKGVHKIFGKVKGKKIFLWAQSPGMQENKQLKELVGPSGKFLWYELKKVGITRDQCDIQNVVRCVPVDINKNIYPPMKMRSPSKEEIKCCSLYTDQALAKSKAKLHLIFGQIAAQAVLKKEYRKDKKIFFSDVLKAWVVVLDHPSFFLRLGFGKGTYEAP
jgi:uracil-DNA glycosylase family 4